MTYEEIESDFERLIKEGFTPFFNERGFRTRQTQYSRQFGDIYQVFRVSKFMRKSKTGPKIMVIQPQFGFFNSNISDIIWPDEKRNTPKVLNGFFQYDLGLYSGTTSYILGETQKDQSIQILIYTIKNELNRSLAPIFDAYKSLDDINAFLQDNKKFKSLGNIYSQHENETEYETVFKRFYYGLAAFYIHTGQMEKAIEILKRKRDIIMTPIPVNRPSFNSEGKYVNSISMEPNDLRNDLPFIARLCKTYDLKIDNV
jgi:hypothetical protein